MMFAVPVGAAVIGALVAMALVTRCSLLRAAMLVPTLSVSLAIALSLFVCSQTQAGGGDMRDLAITVIAMVGAESAVASFAVGLLAGGLRLRYLRRQ